MSASGAAAGLAPSPNRLMILKMQVENFKSYGGTKEIGPFHKCFSSVVGPNGSGKSNVIDAMLFVFGKKAQKLRLNKVSELIHKSAEYPDLEHARVTVFFQSIIDKPGDEDAYEVVAGSQFTVSRVATKNNTSDYFVNGEKSNFGFVTSMLKAKGIDLDHNRFLILQGEVELISQMKPKATNPNEEGLLEYLEDIIGSNAFVERIEEQSKAVEVLTEQRADRIKRLQVAEKDRDALASAKAEAEALQAKDREILRAQGSMVQVMLANARAGATDASDKLKAALAAKEEAKAKMATAEAQGAGLEAKMNAAEASFKSASAAHAAAKASMAEFETKDARLREEATAAKGTAKKGEAMCNREAENVEAARKAGETAKKSVPTLESEVARLKVEVAKEKEAHGAVMGSLTGETEVLRKKLDVEQAALAPKADAATTAKSAADTTRTEMRLLREKVDAGTHELSILREKETKLGKDAAAKAADKNKAQAELNSANARKAALQAEMSAAEAAEKDLQETLGAARSRLDEAKAALSGSGEGGEAQTMHKGGVADMLTKAAGKGGPLAKAGLHGRLGSLGIIDDKYDVAVTTACTALNTYVVDTVAGGQECLQFLRDNRSGRAKLIVLEKQGGMSEAMAKPCSPPEGVPRLFDLIKPTDPKFKPAFYFGLRDTLVADNMDQARRIAFPKDPNAQRWRVVTLKGEMLETTGTMSGGGNMVRKGGMTVASQAGKAGHAAGLGTGSAGGVSPEQVAALEKEVLTLSQKLSDVRLRRKNLVEEGRELEKKVPKLASALSKLDMDGVAVAKMQEDLATTIASKITSNASSKVSADDESALKALVARLATLDAAEKAASAEAEKLEASITDLTRQITAVGGEKIARANARLERATDALDTTTRSLAKAVAEVKSSDKAAATAQAAMNKAKAEAEAAAARYTAIKGDIAATEAQAEPLMGVLAKTAAAVGVEEGAVMAVRSETEGFQRSLRTLKAAEADASSTAADAKSSSDVCVKRVDSLSKKWSKLSEEYGEAMREYVADIAAQVADEEGDAAAAEAGAGAGKPDEAMAGDSGARAMPASVAHPKAVMDRIREPLALPVLTPEQVESTSVEKLQATITGLDAQKEELGRKVNMAAIKEYRAKEREYLKRVAELEATTRARDESRRMYESLRKQRLDTFMAGFSIIGLKLKEMYQMITLGGDAELELEDSLDPFEGIRFSVRPPKKSWKAIANLSGGEKTLSSLALVFALHHYKPTPLYVMDEIDAALDFKNVSIVANYIKERTKNAQFIIISLRNNMFELADRLVGIYKTGDVTKSVTINPKAIAAACGVLSGQENYGPQVATGKGASGRSAATGPAGVVGL